MPDNSSLPCRHLGSQLAEMERVIERMMETDFIDFATAYLTAPEEEEDELEGILVDEVRDCDIMCATIPQLLCVHTILLFYKKC